MDGWQLPATCAETREREATRLRLRPGRECGRAARNVQRQSSQY